MKFYFGEVLTRARQITWRYKSLWFIGIVISLVSFLFASINLARNPAFSSFAIASEVNRQLPPITLSNVSVILLAILSAPLFVIGISIPSLGTFQVEQGSENLHFGQLIRGVLPLGFLTLGIGLVCALPLFILLILGVILVYALMEQGVSAVLVDNLGVFSALQRAWELIQKNPRVMILMSLVSYMVAIVAIMIISIVMMIPIGGSGPNVQLFQTLSPTIILWMLAFLFLYAVFQGMLLTYFQSVWTLIYLRLTRSTTPSQSLQGTGEETT